MHAAADVSSIGRETRSGSTAVRKSAAAAKPAAPRPAKTQRVSLELMSLDVRHMFYKVSLLFLKFR